MLFCKQQSSGWTPLTQQNRWIVCCKYHIWIENTVQKINSCQLLCPTHLLNFLLVGYWAGICLWIQHNEAIIPDNTWTIVRIIALLQHCPKFINFVIPFLQELDWILGERMLKQTVSKILHFGFKLFLFHAWELRKFLCSTEQQVNIGHELRWQLSFWNCSIVQSHCLILQTSQEHGNYSKIWAPL